MNERLLRLLAERGISPGGLYTLRKFEDITELQCHLGWCSEPWYTDSSRSPGVFIDVHEIVLFTSVPPYVDVDELDQDEVVLAEDVWAVDSAGRQLRFPAHWLVQL